MNLQSLTRTAAGHQGRSEPKFRVHQQSSSHITHVQFLVFQRYNCYVQSFYHFGFKLSIFTPVFCLCDQVHFKMIFGKKNHSRFFGINFESSMMTIKCECITWLMDKTDIAFGDIIKILNSYRYCNVVICLDFCSLQTDENKSVWNLMHWMKLHSVTICILLKKPTPLSAVYTFTPKTLLMMHIISVPWLNKLRSQGKSFHAKKCTANIHTVSITQPVVAKMLISGESPLSSLTFVQYVPTSWKPAHSAEKCEIINGENCKHET